MTSQLAEPQPSASLPKGRGSGPGGQPASFLPRAGRCPAPGCGEQIDPSHLMCRRHWNLVPKQLRDTVWATWLSGQGAATPEHQRAVREAITAPHPSIFSKRDLAPSTDDNRRMLAELAFLNS